MAGTDHKVSIAISVMAGTQYIRWDDGVCFVLDQHAKLDNNFGYGCIIDHWIFYVVFDL
jgi:hypothetical protein